MITKRDFRLLILALALSLGFSGSLQADARIVNGTDGDGSMLVLAAAIGFGLWYVTHLESTNSPEQSMAEGSDLERRYRFDLVSTSDSFSNGVALKFKYDF